MGILARKSLSFLKGSVIFLLSIFAILTVSLRLFFPNLEDAKTPLQLWVNDLSGFHIDFSSVTGHWSLFSPSLSLHSLSLSSPDTKQSILTAESINIQFDLWGSLQQWKPTFSNVAIDGLRLDLTQFPERNNQKEISLKKQLERLFLVGLGHFSVKNSTLTLLSSSNQPETIDIESLFWDSRKGVHQVEGIFSVQGIALNHVTLKGAFTEKTGFRSLNGDFYLSLDNFSLKNWIKEFVNPNISIEQAQVGGEVWLTLKNGELVSAQLGLKESDLIWLENTSSDSDAFFLQKLTLLKGRVFLIKDTPSTWTVMSDEWEIKTGRRVYSDPGIQLRFSEEDWLLNIAQLDLFLLMPLRSLFPLSDDLNQAITSLFIEGKAKDIRLEGSKNAPLKYSANLKGISFKHFSYLPELHGLDLTLRGKAKQGTLSMSLDDDILPYGAFFQAPLKIVKSQVALHWLQEDENTLIWSDNLAVRSPDLHLTGTFRLDIPREGSPWLSFYAEADLKNAAETWRYLPTLALGETLTNYLSSAIEGGKVEGAKLLWHGDFKTFPYLEHQGVFQAWVPVREGKFSFDTRWPMLTELDLDLLFHNDSLFLNASHVNLMGAKGFDIKGVIPSFSAKQSILNLDASIESRGDLFRDYMLATPLVDSVGAALTYIQVGGEIDAQIALSVPLDGDDIRIKGDVELTNNHVEVERPKVLFENVTGKIHFDNDIVWAKDVKGNLLEQAVSFDFRGETESSDYLVDLQMSGDWKAAPLKKILAFPDLDLIEGHALWELNLGVALKDNEFTYDIHLETDLLNLNIDVPPPLKKPARVPGKGYLKASGDAEQVIAQLELPKMKYQADINIRGDLPEVERSLAVIGEGALSLHPLFGNVINITYPELDLKAWSRVIDRYHDAKKPNKELPFKLHMPTRVNVRADKVLTENMTFNAFSLSARNKNDEFRIIVGSKELAGYALWERDKRLSVSIEHLFLNFNDEKHKNKMKEKLKEISSQNKDKASEAEMALMAGIPTTDLMINDLWIQGYRLGKVEANLVKTHQKLTLSNLFLGSGDTKLQATGFWKIDAQGINHTVFDFDIEGENSSDLMGRFAVAEGIQDARFMTKANLAFAGPPWDINLKTLNSNIETRLEKGYVSGVGGVGRLLGLFSLESILRKIKFDFSGVFEDGLAFDSISGNATIKDGVLVTDNILMKALAGDMYIKGIANLPQNTVNADVRFVPDLTSGIPVFTAFAVAPQTALYVLALTTVISPVVDVFTQVRYKVSGAIDNPVVNEVSRSSGELILPEKATQKLRSEQKEKAKK